MNKKNAKELYDFSVDIMSDKWDSDKALAAIAKKAEEQIADVLLDQEIFAGVGNIIKNEVLSLVKINPQTLIKDIPNQKLEEIITSTKTYSHQFYEWRKAFVLRKHYRIYQQSKCPWCEGKVTRQKTGKRERFSYYCPDCQPI